MAESWRYLIQWIWQSKKALRKSDPRKIASDVDIVTHREMQILAETSPHLLEDIGLVGISLKDPDPMKTGELAARGATNLNPDAKALLPEGYTQLTDPAAATVKTVAMGYPHSRYRPSRGHQLAGSLF